MCGINIAVEFDSTDKFHVVRGLKDILGQSLKFQFSDSI